MKKRCSKTWGAEQKKKFLLKPDKTDRGAAKQTAPTNAEQEVQLSLSVKNKLLVLQDLTHSVSLQQNLNTNLGSHIIKNIPMYV